MTNEQSLIRRIQKNGDRDAADSLVRAYYDEIFCFVRKQTSSQEIAMDLTQDIFIGMLKTIAHYDGKKAGFRTWLYKISTNKIVDYFRFISVHQVEVLTMENMEPIDETDFTTQFENSDFVARVVGYVDTLPSDTQRIFRLHIFASYTFKEISESLSIPISSVKTTYYRLMNVLRKEFSDDER